MSRIGSVLLGQGVGPARNYSNAMVDLAYGGQHGWAPKLEEWVANQQYVRQNVIPVLLEAPSAFKLLPNPDVWISNLKAIMELHSTSITGLVSGLEVEYQSTPVGGAGQQQEDPVKVNELQSTVTHSLPEKYGMPIHRFFYNYIRYLIYDPHSGYPAIVTLPGAREELGDMLASRRAFSMLYIEPDPTHSQVVKAWLGSNMMPKKSGEASGGRDLTSANEVAKYDIDFTGFYQTGWGVNEFAQRVLDGMNVTGADPYARAAFINEISADVSAVDGGYKSSIDDVAQSAVGS